jgi:hypothetical protein
MGLLEGTAVVGILVVTAVSRIRKTGLRGEKDRGRKTALRGEQDLESLTVLLRNTLDDQLVL